MDEFEIELKEVCVYDRQTVVLHRRGYAQREHILPLVSMMVVGGQHDGGIPYSR